MANYDSITISGSFPASGLIYLDYSSNDSWVTNGRNIDVGIDAPDGDTYTQYLLWGYESVTTSGAASWQDIPASGTIGVTLANQVGAQNLHVIFRTAGLEESAVIDSEDITFAFATPTKSAALSWVDLTDEDNTSAILRNTTDNIDLTFDKTKLSDLRFHSRDFSGIVINNDIITVASGSQIWKLVEHDADGYVPIKKTFPTDSVPFIRANIGSGFRTLTDYDGAIRSDITGDYLNRIDNYSFDSQAALWGSYFDNTKWQPNTAVEWPNPTGSWDGEKWVAEESGGWYYVAIVPSGTWATDFRPTTIRTTISGNAGVAEVYEVYGALDAPGVPSIVDVSNYNSLDEEAMSFSAGGNIAMLLATAQNPFSVDTNELFYTPVEKDLTFDVYKFSQYGFATISTLQFTLDSAKTGYIDTSIALKVKVTDTGGQGVENAPVTFSGTGTDIGDFSVNPVYTDVDGIATATLNLDTLGSATYDASCDGVHTSTDQITWCYPATVGKRSVIEQNTQINGATLNYDDTVSGTGTQAVSEPSSVASSLGDDLNVIRTLMKNIKGTTDWFEDLGNYFDPTNTTSGSADTKVLNLTSIKNNTLDSKTIIVAVEADASGAGFTVSGTDTGFLYTTSLSYANQTDRTGLPVFASSANPGVYFDEDGVDEVCSIDLIDTSTGVEFTTVGGDIIYAKFHDGSDFAGGGEGSPGDVYVRFYANDAPYAWTGTDPTNIMMIFPYRRLMSDMEEYEWTRTDFVNGFEGDAEFIDDVVNLWSFTGGVDGQSDPVWTNISGSFILDNNPTDLESAIDLLNTEIGDRTYTASGTLTNDQTIAASLNALGLGIESNDSAISDNVSAIGQNDTDIGNLYTDMGTLNTDIGNLVDAIGSDTLGNLNYSSNYYVSDGTSIEEAIGVLDAAISVTSSAKYTEELVSDIDANVEHALPDGASYTPYYGTGEEGRNMNVWVEGQMLCADTGVSGINMDRDYAETSASGITFRFDIDAGSNIVYMIYN